MSAAAAPIASLPEHNPFARHRPEDTTLHRVVRENLQTLYAALEEQGTQLPDFVRGELDGYVGCGLLCRGFRLLRCDDCRESQLVAFSCGGRGFCPSCLGRRMAQTAANLVEHVLPAAVPLRQFVLTLPFSLRSRLAYDGELLGAVGHLFTDSVLGFYRRRMALEGFARGRSGVMNVVQRTSSDLKLAPHYHAIGLDGVYVETTGGELAFHALPRLRTDEVADLLLTARLRITNLLERRGLLEQRGDERTQLSLRCDDELAESEPALARLAQTAVGTQPPAGPELRRRIAEVSLPGRPGFTVSGALCVAEQGFSLHAATRVGAHDDRARERLVRYVLRPPLATERLRILDNALVRLELKKPFSDGTVAIDMDPLSLLWRLCATVPPPRRHTVVYSGVLSSHAKWRSRIVPPPTLEPAPTAPVPDTPPPSAPAAADASTPSRARCRRRSRADLLRRSFGLDAEACCRCGGRLRLHAIVQAPASIRRILCHRGEPTEPPPLSPARGPPYWKSRVLHRQADAHAERPDPQRDIFHT